MFDDVHIGTAPDRSGAEAAHQPPREGSTPPAPHRALYLRWRPHRFADVVGQDHVTRTLRNAILRGTLSHAYLFTGPRGTGKTSCARILYRAANCEHSTDGDPCNTCPLCVASLAGRALDLVEIDAASNRGIEDIRDLREKVAYRPGEGRYRVYIIDEAHELTGPAWDAFLKTLEEPPDHAVFVLATTEAHKVPPTIVSRCQRFDFRRIPFEATRDQLRRVAEAEGLDVEPEVLERLARVARGGLRDALSLLDQVGAFSGGHVDMKVARGVLGLPSVEVVRAAVDALGRRDGASLMAQVVDVAEGGADLRQFTEELVSTLRALLLLRAGSEAALASEFSPDELAWLRGQAASWSLGGLAALIGQLSESLARTRDAQQFQIQVELALLGATDVPALSRPAPAMEPPRAALPPSAPSPVAPARPVAVREPAPAAKEIEKPPSQPESQQAAEPTEEKPSPVAPAPAGPESELSLSRIQERWTDILERVRETRRTKGHLLSTASPRRIDPDGRLVISLAPGRMNARVARERDTSEAFVEAIRFVLGRSILVRCVVGDDDAVQGLLDDPVIQFAARTFGGVPRRIERTTSASDEGES